MYCVVIISIDFHNNDNQCDLNVLQGGGSAQFEYSNALDQSTLQSKVKIVFFGEELSKHRQPKSGLYFLLEEGERHTFSILQALKVVMIIQSFV